MTNPSLKAVTCQGLTIFEYRIIRIVGLKNTGLRKLQKPVVVHMAVAAAGKESGRRGLCQLQATGGEEAVPS